MKRRTDKCENKIFSSGGFYVKQMGDVEKSLALLQMAVRLKRMKLQIKGNVIHIISVTCDFDTVTIIEKSPEKDFIKRRSSAWGALHAPAAREAFFQSLTKSRSSFIC